MSINMSASALDQSLDLLKDTYNYNHWIYTLLRPWLGNNVLEVGSGPGNLTRFLLDREKLLCVEPNDYYLNNLKMLAHVHANISVVQGRDSCLANESYFNSFDTIVCLNVLEHINDDLETLKTFAHALNPLGALLLYVPACPWAYGTLDRKLGHYRRYNKKGLREKLREAGLIIHRCVYVNFIGVFGWWWTSCINRAESINPQKARLIDRCVPFLSALERIAPPPIGQSLFVVAKKNTETFGYP